MNDTISLFIGEGKNKKLKNIFRNLNMNATLLSDVFLLCFHIVMRFSSTRGALKLMSNNFLQIWIYEFHKPGSSSLYPIVLISLHTFFLLFRMLEKFLVVELQLPEDTDALFDICFHHLIILTSHLFLHRTKKSLVTGWHIRTVDGYQELFPPPFSWFSPRSNKQSEAAHYYASMAFTCVVGFVKHLALMLAFMVSPASRNSIWMHPSASQKTV